MAHALVTGASGFIGHHLVKLLSERGDDVTCLVRRQSNRIGLEPFHPNYAVGDVTDLESVRRSLHGIDVVYHLAGLTKSLRAEALFHVNEAGTRNIARAWPNGIVHRSWWLPPRSPRLDRRGWDAADRIGAARAGIPLRKVEMRRGISWPSLFRSGTDYRGTASDRLRRR